MGEFFVRRATPADVDRLWQLFDEVENERLFLQDAAGLTLAEQRRAALVTLLLDPEHPVLVAYSGVRAVGYLRLPEGEPYVSASWRGLGVDVELRAFAGI
jgi:hypothetical protein